ncbi:MAG: pyridoxal phosphate-dependent aminotransferase [Clostridiales bacterium]|nr:pyridoxal phosphate-dependent aminotransferase [Clostridiales bacterium]
MIYDASFFDKPIDRRNTACEKWDGLMAKEKRELNPMWVADMDFRCPNEVHEAMVRRAQHPVYGYTAQTDAADEAMLAFMERRHGITLTKEQQAMLPCVITGLKAGVCALTEVGDSIIVQPPVYGPFYASIRANDRIVLENPLICDGNGRYTMDFDGLEDCCKAGAKLMLLCSPHNPIGRAWTKEELTKLLEILARYNVALISDEIHEDFVFEPSRFVPILSLAEAEDAKIFSLTSASKSFNLAGLQQAILFTRNMELKEMVLSSMNRAGVVSGNIFGMVASEAAYQHGDAWLDGMLSYVKQGEMIAREELGKRLPKVIFTPLEATYLGWLDMRAYGYHNEELMKRTYDAGVAFTTGTFFGAEAGDGFLRINLACPHAQIIDAIIRLEQAING